MARRKRSLLPGSLKSKRGGTSLVAKTPCSRCGVPGSIPRQGTRSHVAPLKIPHASAKRFHTLQLSRGSKRKKIQTIMWTKCEIAVLIRLKDGSTMTACIKRFFIWCRRIWKMSKNWPGKGGKEKDLNRKWCIKKLWVTKKMGHVIRNSSGVQSPRWK